MLLGNVSRECKAMVTKIDSITLSFSNHEQAGGDRPSSSSAKADDPVFQELSWISQGHGDRDRGEPRGSAPPTPPYVRVRIRRFDRLSMLGCLNGCKAERFEYGVG